MVWILILAILENFGLTKGANFPKIKKSKPSKLPKGFFREPIYSIIHFEENVSGKKYFKFTHYLKSV